MSGVIDGFRAVLLGAPFDATAIIVSAAVAIAICVFALVYFSKVERRFADVILRHDSSRYR
jgi:ABC-type polysaccharide/polyol phosphate export permease